MTPQQKTELGNSIKRLATVAAAQKLEMHRYDLSCLTPQERALLISPPGNETKDGYTITLEEDANPPGKTWVLRFHGAYRGHWSDRNDARKAAGDPSLQKMPVRVKNIWEVWGPDGRRI